MKQLPFFASMLVLAACNSAQSVSTTEQAPAEQTPAASTSGTEVSTEQQAAAVATRYFRSQPDSAVYLVPTLRVMDAGPRWQVLVKRSDRVNIKPDGSAIEIDKQTGVISTVAVK
ncbi:hypothetical protein ACFPAF_13280 [Hymenobacter endophyticus]|uniref:PepSY domain-containing protein n=1 Tax=Hymenobacter endophyticus TaxID=3076335 RepID=A0ABU3TJ15_9BACT|nr:hypothetical protein [Hymenobacter endophyticus]MDU0371374.1 hypothetical protein [Hymenobacter endophyticus]